MNYEKEALVFKALSDTNRLKIIDMLSCSCIEMCACHLLEKFDITQPTLSHHMKILIEAGIVNSRKQGSWCYYFLNQEKIFQVVSFMSNFTIVNGNCTCG